MDPHLNLHFRRKNNAKTVWFHGKSHCKTCAETAQNSWQQCKTRDFTKRFVSWVPQVLFYASIRCHGYCYPLFSYLFSDIRYTPMQKVSPGVVVTRLVLSWATITKSLHPRKKKMPYENCNKKNKQRADVIVLACLIYHIAKHNNSARQAQGSATSRDGGQHFCKPPFFLCRPLLTTCPSAWTASYMPSPCIYIAFNNEIK